MGPLYSRTTVLVIGAGLAGTATAIRLLQFAREPLGVVLLERRNDYRYAGVAYHRGGDLEIHADHVRVPTRRSTGGETALTADHAILATGMELRQPAFATGVLDHDAFIRHPYSTDGVRRLTATPAGASVVIVGTVLSAYDSVAVLLRRGHTGPIHLVSRSGTTPRAYPDHHEHGVIELPAPTSLFEPYQDRAEFLTRVTAAWETACAAVAEDHPDIDERIVPERVATAWEPHLPRIIDRIPTGELRGLLRDFSTQIASLRVGAVSYTTSVVEEAMSSGGGPVELVVGSVARVTPAASGQLDVIVVTRAGERAIPAGLVVCNFGREVDYTRVGSPLWTSLLTGELVTPHERTGRGIEIDNSGTPLRPSGEPTERLSAIGVMREGDEIVRNGRTGAFAFNLAAIKNHSIVVAASVVDRLERHGDDTSTAHRAVTVDEADRDGFEKAVALEVKRLAARTRSEREHFDTQLAEHVNSGHPSSAHHFRAAVNQAAVRRLTDISVTPRQLRRQLGISTDEEAKSP